MKRIGLLSDTHGFLDPKIKSYFAEVDEIWHAGDIGSIEVLDELKAFKIDPRFEVNCFASEEDFPEMACPIQMRWDKHGRLWVST